MKFLKFIPIISIATVGIFSSCTHEPDLSNQPTISFATDIQPLIGTNCATSGCHNGGDDLVKIESYEDVMKIVKAKDARSSKLYSVITKLYGEQAMPPSKPLTEAQIQTVYLWIMQGALNN